MAWIKEIINPSNKVQVPYWELINVHYNHRQQLSLFEYGGWYSKEAYDEGADAVIVETIEIPAGQAPELAAGALSFGTGVIRAQAKFAGSQDA